MSREIKIFAVIAISILFTSCARSCNKWKRDNQVGKRSYDVVMYSGGDTVFKDSFHGILNDLPGEGVYYFKGDTMVEISGDYIIRSNN